MQTTSMLARRGSAHGVGGSTVSAVHRQHPAARTRALSGREWQVQPTGGDDAEVGGLLWSHHVTSSAAGRIVRDLAECGRAWMCLG